MKRSFTRGLIIFQLIVCCGLAISVKAQHGWIEDPDSLRRLITAAKDDTSKFWLLHNLTVLNVYNKPDSGLRYGNQLLSLARQLNYKTGIAIAYSHLAVIYNVLGNYPFAVHNAFEAAKIYEENKDSMAIAHTNDILGEIYYMMGDFKTALVYEYKTRKVVESLPDTFSWASGNVGLKKQSLMYSDAGLSTYYLLGGMRDSALHFAKSAYNADRDLQLDWSYTPLVLGNAYLNLNEPDSALKYYRLPIKIHAVNDETEIKIGIAKIFDMKGQADSAIYYAKMALDTAREIHYIKAVMNASQFLSNIYERTNPAEAIRYYKISIAAKDSLYNREKVNEVNSVVFGEERRVRDLQEAKSKYNNRLRLYALIAIAAVFLIIGILLFRNNQHRKRAYHLLREQKRETDLQKEKAEQALENLKSTQAQLIQSEKMASLGELTAGIAHEIQNPLNFVNNFSDVNSELIDEMKVELSAGNSQEAMMIADSIRKNLEKIDYHGKRADAIVKGMLQHSRTNTGQKELVDINALADEYLRLSYHGMRAKDKSFTARLETDFDPATGEVKVVPNEIGRVLLNLYNNAFYAVNQKTKEVANGYEPVIAVKTKRLKDKIQISIADNGGGIPQKVAEKIFQPFFTTKPAGQGTGLGLSLSYDIIKAHGGEIKVETKEGEGSEFIIQLSAKGIES